MFPRKIRAPILAGLLMVGAGSPAVALGPDDYIGSVGLVGFSFCPRGTAEAAGQLESISDFQALFSLYGNTYGGDGRQTFGLPDLRQQVPRQGMRYCVVLDGIYPSRH